MKRLLVLGAVAFAGGFAPAACSLHRWQPVPLPEAATSALAEARAAQRVRPPGWRERARAAAERAAAAAPDWIAPARVLDDLERDGLLGHEALGLRRAALEPESSAAELYLAGRLEGRAGLPHIELAARLDPELAWAWHGLAWNRFLEGDARAALRSGRRALELARGSYELSVFATSQARYLASLGRAEEARDVLERTLADARLAEPETTELGAALARAELASSESAVAERGFWRGVVLLEGGQLSEEEWGLLGDALVAQRALTLEPDPIRVLLAALEATACAPGARLRAWLLDLQGAHGLAGAAWEEAGGGALTEGFRRVRALQRGDIRSALEDWCAALPTRLRDAEGRPREPRLAALLQAAREVGAPGGAERFGQELLACGWFREAEAYAGGLVSADPTAALALAGRASAAQALLGRLQGLLESVDDGRDALVPERGRALAPARRIRDLDELLEAMQPAFERFHGGALASDLVDSPRLHFGAFASVVHPGPTFSALDEREGRGHAGEPVPGLARELARIGRFGIFGEAPGGGGPDGAVLRLVLGEWREGEHLGVHWAGWVAWCEGADVESRPGRQGSHVSGAALHEGYWVDLEGVRRDWDRVRALERDTLAADPARVTRALEGLGARLPDGAAVDERARWLEPLGEGERVLLAVLRERPEAPAGRVGFDELVELTALHEEGHLTDRTRFLPLTAHWSAALGLVLRHGLSPRAIARALEYRAQLVALCEAAEPRLVLSECLSASESSGGALAHGEAYRRLVEGLLRLAARALDDYPVLEREHYLIHQLHRLAGEDVRRLARALAREEGLLAD